jgi:hypothetical protein
MGINDEADPTLCSVDLVANSAVVIVALPEHCMSVDRPWRMGNYDRSWEASASNINVHDGRHYAMTRTFRSQS